MGLKNNLGRDPKHSLKWVSGVKRLQQIKGKIRDLFLHSAKEFSYLALSSLSISTYRRFRQAFHHVPFQLRAKRVVTVVIETQCFHRGDFFSG